MSFRHSLRNLITISYLAVLSFLAFQLNLHLHDQIVNKTSRAFGIKSDIYTSRKNILPSTEFAALNYLPGDEAYTFTFPAEESSLVSVELEPLKKLRGEQLRLTRNDVLADLWESEPLLAPSASEGSKLRGNHYLESLRSIRVNISTASSSNKKDVVYIGFWVNFNPRSTFARSLHINTSLIHNRVGCITCVSILSLFVISVCLSSFLGIYFVAVLLYPLGDSFTLAAYVLAVGAFAWSALMAWHSPWCRAGKRGGAGVDDGELAARIRA